MPHATEHTPEVSTWSVKPYACESSREKRQQDRQTDGRTERQTHRRTVQNHFSRRFEGCTSEIRSYLEVDFLHDANTSIDMEVKQLYKKRHTIPVLGQQNLKPVVFFSGHFRRHQFPSLKLSKLVADMVLHSSLKVRTRLPELFLNFEKLKVANFTRHVDTNLKISVKAFCGNSNAEVAKIKIGEQRYVNPSIFYGDSQVSQRAPSCHGTSRLSWSIVKKSFSVVEYLTMNTLTLNNLPHRPFNRYCTKTSKPGHFGRR